VRPAGGMGTAMSFLALALARIGHSVEILLGFDAPNSIEPHWQTAYDDAGIELRRAPPSPETVEPWHFESPHSTALGLREGGADVVIAHDFGAPIHNALRLRQAGVAFENTLFVVFCHGTRRYIVDLSPTVGLKDLRQVLAVGILEQASVELADVVVSPSAYLLDWMRERGWRLPQRSFVIPYFTRSSAIGEPPPTRPSQGERLERLAFFGRVDERKGLKIFAAALNALEPELLDGLELEFLGKTTGTWTRERAEGLLSDRTRRALHSVGLETELDQPEALARLSRPGTLAVMPTLHENSPNTVYECLEHGIPFAASAVGGIPELIADEDRRRVLFEPTARGVAEALRPILAAGIVPGPARAAFRADDSARRWAEVVSLAPAPAVKPGRTRLDVVVSRSRKRPREDAEGAGTAPAVLFLDEDDVPDPELVQSLVQAQAASGAAAVTCGLRLVDDDRAALHFFSGEPGGLGALANGFGTPVLLRRDALAGPRGAWPAGRDPDWPLLAELAMSGAQVVSIPLPLVTRHVRPGAVEDDPGDALLAIERLEGGLPRPLRLTARLAAGLAAGPPAPQAEEQLVARARRVVRRLASRR
jgi:glycosyltransferase involved in cell wall biosynthesis